MADQLDIYVTVEDGKTISRFAADIIWFHNEGSADLTIGFKPNQPDTLAFCKNKNDDHTKGTPTLIIEKGKKDGTYICSDFPGTTFGYTAKIGTADQEDPIIILGKDSKAPWIVANLPVLGAGVALGIVLTLVALPLFRKQRPA